MSRMERHRARREGIVNENNTTIKPTSFTKNDFDTTPTRRIENTNIRRDRLSNNANVKHNVVDLEELKKSAVSREENASFDLDEAFTRLKKDISNPNMDTQLEVMTNLLSDRYDEFNSTQQLRKPVGSKNKTVNVEDILSTLDKEDIQPKKKSFYQKISALNPRDTKKDELKASLLEEQLKAEQIYNDKLKQEKAKENIVSDLAHLSTPVQNVVEEEKEDVIESIERVDFSKEKEELNKMINELVANEDPTFDTKEDNVDMLANPSKDTGELLIVKKNDQNETVINPIVEEKLEKKKDKKEKKAKDFEHTVEQSQLEFDKMVMDAGNDKAGKVLIAVIIILIIVFAALLYLLFKGIL